MLAASIPRPSFMRRIGSGKRIVAVFSVFRVSADSHVQMSPYLCTLHGSGVPSTLSEVFGAHVHAC